jgi:glycosyltransferase 2 family protein
MNTRANLVKIGQTVFGYTIAAACLIWVFHGVDLDLLLAGAAAINWPLALAGVLVDITAYLFQSLRWRAILSPFGPVSPKQTLKAIYAGIFINLVVPLRVGELVRVYLISRFMKIQFSRAFSSLIVEYLFDGLWLTIGASIAAFILPMPTHFHQAGLILGIVLLIAIAAMILVIVKHAGLTRFFAQRQSIAWRPLRILTNFTGTMTNSLHAIGTTPALFSAAFFAGCMLFAHCMGFWLVMRAYGIQLSFVVGAGVLVFKYIALIIPNAPSNVGAYQFVIVLALTFFKIDKTTATGFSVAVFVLLLFPQFLFGAYAFFRSGSTMAQMRAAIDDVRKS